jgi:hypothetical protein
MPPVLLPEEVLAAVADYVDAARAKVRVGYPWWLRPFLQKGVVAITLGRRIYLAEAMSARPPAALARLLRHELTHVKQVNRLTLPLFLILYLAEFLRNLWRYRSAAVAYRRISFEEEAWAAEEEAAGTAL